MRLGFFFGSFHLFFSSPVFFFFIFVSYCLLFIRIDGAKLKASMKNWHTDSFRTEHIVYSVVCWGRCQCQPIGPLLLADRFDYCQKLWLTAGKGPNSGLQRLQLQLHPIRTIYCWHTLCVQLLNWQQYNVGINILLFWGEITINVANFALELNLMINKSSFFI